MRKHSLKWKHDSKNATKVEALPQPPSSAAGQSIARRKMKKTVRRLNSPMMKKNNEAMSSQHNFADLGGRGSEWVAEVRENAGEERSPAKMKRNVRNRTMGKGLTFPEFERKQRNGREERKEWRTKVKWGGRWRSRWRRREGRFGAAEMEGKRGKSVLI